MFMKSMDWVMNAALCQGFLHGDLNESQCIRFLDRSTISPTENRGLGQEKKNGGLHGRHI